MFERVLVGVDGGPGGRDALALAQSLRAVGGRLTLANVYPPQAYVWRGANPGYEPRDRADAQATLTVARKRSGLEADLRPVESPSVGTGLHKLSEALGADLLVVGCSRRGPLQRVVLGDDTQAVLNHASCPVAIAPTGYAKGWQPIARVGVGYDGSPESQHALAVARELGDRSGAQLSLFHAVSVPARAVMAGEDRVTMPVEELVEEAYEKLSDIAGVEIHVAYGQAKDELSSFSASVDLLVVGSRGYGPLGRLVHGSTSAQLARTTRCPLLVLPRAARW